MPSEITEHFVRHYGLVLNNDQSAYNAAQDAIRQVTEASDVTVSQYLEMDDEIRRVNFAEEIGTRLLDMIREWCEAVTDKEAGSLGSTLIAECMNYGGGDLAYFLGADFLPEDADADEFFADDETESESDEG